MKQITRMRVFVSLHGWSWMEIPPTIQPYPLQDAAHRGRAEAGGMGDVISRAMLATQCNDVISEKRRSGAGTAPGARGSIQQPKGSFLLMTANPLGNGLRSYSEQYCRVGKTRSGSNDIN